MERGSFQGIAAGLERIIENTRCDLREAMDQFQGLCLTVTPGRNIPTEIITDIRQIYKQIQAQLTKINGAKQLLEGKYRQYYHRDSKRERESLEIAFLARSLYLTFEYTLQEMEAKGKLRKEEYFEAHCQHMPSPWFQSKVNQIILLRNLQSLNELDYKTKFESGFDRRREVIRNGIRSISLFALSGDITLIDTLQSRMRFREYDIIERYREDEFRVALTHLRDVSPSEVQKVLRRFADAGEFLKLKCLLLRIQSQKDLKKETLRSTENVLHRMGEGEVRILSI